MKNPPRQVVITATNLIVGYGKNPLWSAAEFAVQPGEFIAVLGPNGAGKSTLLRTLLGLQKPGAGKVTILGHAPERGNAEIGYVPQLRSIDPEAAICGRDFVRLGSDGMKWGIAFPGKHYTAQQKHIDAAIAAVGATEFAHRRIGELSGGERQRLLLAQALVGEPKILLLDEPAASLDLKNQIKLAELVSNISKKQCIAVLLVTHDLNPLLPFVDRVLYIGRTGVAIGTPNEVINSDVLSRLYGTPVEVVTDHLGRQFIVGMEDVMAHPHAGHDHGEGEMS